MTREKMLKSKFTRDETSKRDSPIFNTAFAKGSENERNTGIFKGNPYDSKGKRIQA